MHRSIGRVFRRDSSCFFPCVDVRCSRFVFVRPVAFLRSFLSICPSSRVCGGGRNAAIDRSIPFPRNHADSHRYLMRVISIALLCHSVPEGPKETTEGEKKRSWCHSSQDRWYELLPPPRHTTKTSSKAVQASSTSMRMGKETNTRRRKTNTCVRNIGTKRGPEWMDDTFHGRPRTCLPCLHARPGPHPHLRLRANQDVHVARCRIDRVSFRKNEVEETYVDCSYELRATSILTLANHTQPTDTPNQCETRRTHRKVDGTATSQTRRTNVSAFACFGCRVAE